MPGQAAAAAAAARLMTMIQCARCPSQPPDISPRANSARSILQAAPTNKLQAVAHIFSKW